MAEEQSEQTKMLAGLRNCFQQAVENIDIYLNWLGQKQGFQDAEKVSQEQRRWSWNPDGIKWTKTKGAREEYERYPAEDQKIEATPDYKNMLQDLKEHAMFISRDNVNYWVFPDLVTVGRKQKEVKARTC